MYEIDSKKVAELESSLRALLRRELTGVIDNISKGDRSDLMIKIPDPMSIDLSIEEVSSLVARSSNAYVTLSRYAGIAKADAKLAAGRYERKFKSSKGMGSSESERVANAMKSAQDEHMDMTNAEAIADIASALEAGARVASESSRKLLDSMQKMMMGQAREARGELRESDFSIY